jgi:hypothetical protein
MKPAPPVTRIFMLFGIMLDNRRTGKVLDRAPACKGANQPDRIPLRRRFGFR